MANLHPALTISNVARATTKNEGLRLHIRGQHAAIEELFLCIHTGCHRFFDRKLSVQVHVAAKHVEGLRCRRCTAEMRQCAADNPN